MSRKMEGAKYKEVNNFRSGRIGAATPKKMGPAAGRKGHVNPTKGGGIYRATKGKGG